MALIEFRLPDLGEGVAEGEIISWKVQPDQQVTEDQAMVEVMTDKATVEIGSPVTGRVIDLLVQEGETVPVNQVIVVLEDSGEATAGAEAPAEAKGPAKAEAPVGDALATRAKTPATAELDVPAALTIDEDIYEEVNFALPDIGEGVAEGEVTRWMVNEGDDIVEDRPMLEVMTDKATVEIGSPVDGKVLKILVPEGATVPVGKTLLVLGALKEGAVRPAPAVAPKSAAAPKTAAAAPASEAEPAAEVTLEPDAEVALEPAGDSTGAARPASKAPRAAPAVRRLAREMGVDLWLVVGTGPGGRISLGDVRGAAGAGGTPPVRRVAPPAVQPAPAPRRRPEPTSAPAAASKPAERPAPPRTPAAQPRTPAAPLRAASVSAPKPHDLAGDRRERLAGLRKRIATQMRVARQVAAHFSYVEEIDVTDMVKLRKQAAARSKASGVKFTFMPFIIKAILPGLKEFPLLNASLDEEAGEIVYHAALNIGIAVDTPRGLIVPVVRNADTKSMTELAREISELADRAREGKARPEDLGGGTFTITNAGSIGGMLATPIINVPEVAILGVHAIRRKPWVVDDRIVIRDIMCLSISLDHRVVDGAVGARFMNRVKELLENPALMWVEEF